MNPKPVSESQAEFTHLVLPQDTNAIGTIFGGRIMEWVDIAAALRQPDSDTTHIALATMPLNDEGLGDALTTLLPLLGRLEIEVVELD